MKHIKYFLLTLLATLFAPQAIARDFTYDGIIYTVISEEDFTCMTKSGDAYVGGNSVSGELVIPAKVSDGTNEYNVTDIGLLSFNNNEDLTKVSLAEGLISINFGAFENCTNLKSIVLPINLTTIGEYAFHSCKSLESVEIPQSVTTIGRSVFASCDSLTSVILPDGLTSIEYGLFMDCINLSSINIPESVTSIGSHAFSQCKSLSSITLPENLTEIGKMAFANCTGLTSVLLPDKLTAIGESTFMGCRPLEVINLPGSLVEIGLEAFYDCPFLKEIIYRAVDPITASISIFHNSAYQNATLNTPNASLEAVQATEPWNQFKHIAASDGSVGLGLASGDDFVYKGMTYTVIDAEAKTVKTKENWYQIGENITGDIFDHWFELPPVVNDGINDYTVVEIGAHTFDGCEPLTDITFPETLRKIGMYAFEGCSNLQSIFVGEGAEQLRIESIGYRAFANCTALYTAFMPASLTELGEAIFYNCKSLYMLDLSAVGITEIPSEMFYSCQSLAHISFPETLLSIGRQAFANSGLTSIELPESLTSIGESAFSTCPDLVDVQIPESLTSIGDKAFWGCGMRTLTLPSSLTSIGNRAFERCEKIRTVNYPATDLIVAPEDIFDTEVADIYALATLNTPNATLANVLATDPWNKFKQIYASDDFIAPSSKIDEFEYEGVWYQVKHPIGGEATTVSTRPYFSEEYPGNSYEGDLIIPSKVFYAGNEFTVVEIGHESFFNNTGLISVTLPETVKTISLGGFSGCSSLVSVHFPPTLEYIHDSAFKDCASLATVSLPDSLKSISSGVFRNCTALQSVTLPADVQELRNVFEQCPNITEVTYYAETPVLSSNGLFDSTVYATATLNMPDATLESILAVSPWRRFQHIVAKDGSVGFVSNGDDFEYDGIWYTIIDTDRKTVKTKDGMAGNTDIIAPNIVSGDVIIPAEVSYEGVNYTVVGIGVSSFNSCEELTSISLPNTLKFIDTWAFFGCNHLSSITLPESLEELGIYFLAGCSSLTVISIPEKITEIPHGAFDGCVSLSKVTLPENLTVISINAFLGCYSLTDINMPLYLRRIDGAAFSGCALTSFELALSLEYIGDWAFSGNPLTSVTIPAGVVEIGEEPFKGCFDIREVYYWAENPVRFEASIFEESVYESATLSTPFATLASVQATTPWNLFGHINASDGSIVPGPSVGEDIEVDGMTFTVIDSEHHLLQTKAGNPEEGMAGNTADGDLVIPSTVTVDGQEYTVTEIGDYGFSGNSDLLSVTIPGTITNIGEVTFSDCERLTSLIWLGNAPLQSGVVEGIGNPNLLVYVNSPEAAPEGMGHNVVVGSDCDNLVLTPGYPFYPAETFFSRHSEMTKSFTQQTPIGGSAGWETLAVPFHPTSIKAADGRALVSFRMLTDITSECPFWLYEADAHGEWMAADSIRQGVPFLISMPNNDEYDWQYRVEGAVTFVSDEYTLILPKTCTPYVTTWASGREFRSLWLPLTEAEAAEAMGLNVGVSDLTDDNGQILLPGSAFHADVVPRPLEAYVSRIDSRRAMPVRGGQNFVGMMAAEGGLRIAVDLGTIVLSSDRDRIVDVVSPDGVVIKRAPVKAGKEYRIEYLTRGIYIVAGRKITVK